MEAEPVSLLSPNKAELAYMRACKEFCIACHVEGHGRNPAHFHHILKNGKRISHMDGFGLCNTHHASGLNNFVAVSRHPWKKAFEARFGTEQELLALTRELIGVGA